jgi:hypothetical protein
MKPQDSPADTQGPGSPYADRVTCPKCGALPGRSCTFVHFATRQRIATFYHPERIEERRSSR